MVQKSGYPFEVGSFITIIYQGFCTIPGASPWYQGFDTDGIARGVGHGPTWLRWSLGGSRTEMWIYHVPTGYWNDSEAVHTLMTAQKHWICRPWKPLFLVKTLDKKVWCFLRQRYSLEQKVWKAKWQFYLCKVTRSACPDINASASQKCRENHSTWGRESLGTPPRHTSFSAFSPLWRAVSKVPSRALDVSEFWFSTSVCV